MSDLTCASITVHTYAETEIKIYNLDGGTGRDVLRFGDTCSVLLYPADLVRLRDDIDAYLANASQAEAA